MKTRIPSTIVASVFILMNGFFLRFLLLPLDFSTLLSGSTGALEGTENMGMIALMPLLIVGGMIVFLLFWMIAIAITHAILLVFTIKNRHSPIKSVRIINLFLDVANGLFIAAPLIKLGLMMLT